MPHHQITSISKSCSLFMLNPGRWFESSSVLNSSSLWCCNAKLVKFLFFGDRLLTSRGKVDLDLLSSAGDQMSSQNYVAVQIACLKWVSLDMVTSFLSTDGAQRALCSCCPGLQGSPPVVYTALNINRNSQWEAPLPSAHLPPALPLPWPASSFTIFVLFRPSDVFVRDFRYFRQWTSNPVILV